MSRKKWDQEESLGFLVERARRSLWNRLAQNFQSADMDISPEQWTVLVELWNDDCVKQQALADRLDREKTTLSRLLDGLEKKGFIERRASPDNRRDKLIHLTAAGECLQNDLLKLARKTLREASVGIAAERLKVAKDVLREVAGNLD